MSYELTAALVTELHGDSALSALLAVDAQSGVSAIYPYHHRDITNPVFPMVTVARFGDGIGSDRFSESDFATLMDCPKIAICVYAQKTLDQAYAAYRRIEQLLRGKSVQSSYVSSYTWLRMSLRDDLFDTEASAYHIHSEWKTWAQLVSNNPLPIPT